MHISHEFPGASDTAGPQAALPGVTVVEKHMGLCFPFLGALLCQSGPEADVGIECRERKFMVDEERNIWGRGCSGVLFLIFVFQ